MPTRISPRNRYDLGHVKGEPVPYINGHQARGLVRLAVRWLEEDCGYETPCWVWQGCVDSQTGYGRATVRSTGPGFPARTNGAHRIVYEEQRGPIPEGLVIDHLCRNRACVNPDHLEPVTHGENIRRGYAFLRAA